MKVFFLKSLSFITVLCLLGVPVVLPVAVGADVVEIQSIVRLGEGTTGVSGLDNDDRYGMWITNIGDIDGNGVLDIAVGATKDEAGATLDTGAVYIHRLNSDGTVLGTTKIGEGSTGVTGLDNLDQYGHSIADLGDIDGPGGSVRAIAVGARYDENAQSGSGAVYIHTLNSVGTVLSTVKLTDGHAQMPTLDADEYYGSRIVNLGDVDGNGVNDIAVSAWKDEAGATLHFGAVFIHLLNSSGNPISTVQLGEGTTGVTPVQSNDGYGYTMDVIPDIDSNGVNDLLVGARYFDVNLEGGAFVHLLDNTGNVIGTLKLDANTTGLSLDANDNYSLGGVASIGDVDGDGVSDIAVGSWVDEKGATADTGAVYVHLLESPSIGTVTLANTVVLGEGTTDVSGLDANDLYGTDVAGLGDLNNDGVVDIVVTARQDEISGSGDEGALYIHHLNAVGDVVEGIKLGQGISGFTGFDTGDWFGYRVDNIGDIDGNGINDLAIGSIYDEVGATSDTGSVYLVLLGPEVASTTPNNQGGLTRQRRFLLAAAQHMQHPVVQNLHTKACPHFSENLQFGDRDYYVGGVKTEVGRMQEFLVGTGFGSAFGPMPIDGIFGELTRIAVKEWQGYFADQVLRVWSPTLKPTGFWGLSSRWLANQQVGCRAERIILDNGVVLPSSENIEQQES